MLVSWIISEYFKTKNRNMKIVLLVSSFRLFDEKTKERGVVVRVPGLKEVTVHNKSQVYEILSKGFSRRTTSSTKMNASSRYGPYQYSWEFVIVYRLIFMTAFSQFLPSTCIIVFNHSSQFAFFIFVSVAHILSFLSRFMLKPILPEAKKFWGQKD